MKISLVVAMAENGVIGRGGKLPWRLAADMRRFKTTTMGKPVIMGRRTWESLSRQPLPGRHNIVITRNHNYIASGGDIVASLEEALALAALDESEEVSIIGGGQVYQQALVRADRLDITHVLADIEGDTYFPRIRPEEWRAVSSRAYPAGAQDMYATRHTLYERA